MSVINESSRIIYSGNNSTLTPYPVPFPFHDSTDLVIVLTNPLSGAQTLVINRDYTVTGGAGSTGNVKTSFAVEAENSVTITRTITITQPTTYTDLGKFPSSSVDRSFDRAAMIDQQLARRIEEVAVVAGSVDIDGGDASSTGAVIYDGGGA